MRLLKKYKDSINKWESECKRIDMIIASNVKIIENEIREKILKENEKNKEEDKKANESNCSVCGNKQFIMKYRDVNGKIKGGTSGYFSLFGGSISGYVDGDISTAPVLGCRQCGNERRIQITKDVSFTNTLRDMLPSVFDDGTIYFEDRIPWAKEKGLEVIKELANLKLSCYDSKLRSIYNYQKIGIINKYPYPKKPNIFDIIFEKKMK